ncbi:MAG: methyltransferase domain-containing protein [Gammaproteobacteria bacterium]|nr:MAG: methyltransferase domain-containing protein [Gammaproteobacteria bacterium]
MDHENEYHDSMVKMLELIWGAGYMAPGGAGNVARMLDGLEPAGKRILDIGSGIGGPALDMAATHGATVVGIDLEEPLVARANADSEKAGLDQRCTFLRVDQGPLPFDTNEFDVVTSSGALTQTEDKSALFAEILRVLRPAGWLSVYDWMKVDGEYSADMRYWFEMEGLTYAMVTLEQQAALLGEAGFENVAATDATEWYRREAWHEYERLRGELKPKMIELLGTDEAEHFIENWRAMVVVIDTGEMRQAYCRGQKPVI